MDSRQGSQVQASSGVGAAVADLVLDYIRITNRPIISSFLLPPPPYLSSLFLIGGGSRSL
jgi:hypothetical protein